MSDPANQFPAADLERREVSRFIVRLQGRPVGILRTLFDPPLLQYAGYGLRLIDPRDVEDFLRRHRIAEVGRFAVVLDHRGNMMLVASLMRSATEEMVTRGYTHVITDVFEDDPHSPLGFHTRVMGFRPSSPARAGASRCCSTWRRTTGGSRRAATGSTAI